MIRIPITPERGLEEDGEPTCGTDVPVVVQASVCLISLWWCLYFMQHHLIIIRKRTQVMSLINGDQVLLSPAGSGHFVNSHKKTKSGPFWRLWIQTTTQGGKGWKAKQNHCLEFLLWVMSWGWDHASDVGVLFVPVPENLSNAYQRSTYDSPSNQRITNGRGRG